MNFQSHFLVTYLLLLFFFPRGVMVEENIVWGILAQSIFLDIPDLPKDKEIDDIRWSEGQTLIGKVSLDKVTIGKNPNYEIFKNGTLKIKELKEVSEQNYTVTVYDKNGKNLLKKTLTLSVMEAVSKPEMTWNCTIKSIFCENQNGTDPEMTLFINETQPLKKGTLTKEGLKLKYTWEDPQPREFKCVVKNKVSEEWVVGQPSCSDEETEHEQVKVLDIYHILSICGGGVILLIFLTLLISCCLRRKRQSNQTNVRHQEDLGSDSTSRTLSRVTYFFKRKQMMNCKGAERWEEASVLRSLGENRKDQNLESNSARINMEERSRKLHQSPGHHPQQSGGRHPQQPCGHRSQAAGHRLHAPGHCPPVPGHRPRPQPKRPSPNIHQQSGPPLPRPRNQQMVPHQEKENR